MLSVRAVSLSDCATVRSELFANWLQKHSPAAPIECITVKGTWDSAMLQLPVQQLKFLRKLDLTSATVCTASSDDAEPVLGSALSPLTSLALRFCEISLQGLPALTALQNLTLSTARGADPSSSKAALIGALPRLLQVTALDLAGAIVDDDVLTKVSALAGLQDLQVAEGSSGARITGSAFAQLPSGLTRLVIECAFRIGLQPSDPELHVSSSSTPALSKLTALQELRCGNVASFHCELLTALTGLTKLGASKFTAPGDAPRLLVLTGLTRLQHLELLCFDSNNPPAVQPEDFAAITSSPQLTHLHIGHGSVDPDDQQGFALCHTDNGGGDQVLPGMRALHLPAAWLLCPKDMDRTARCCPNLEQLSLASSGFAAVSSDSNYADSFRHFSEVSSLTRLDISAEDLELTVRVWDAIASLTTLQHLFVDAIVADDVGGVMQLTSCRQLTELTMRALQMGHPDPAHDGYMIIKAMNEVRLGAAIPKGCDMMGTACLRVLRTDPAHADITAMWQFDFRGQAAAHACMYCSPCTVSQALVITQTLLCCALASVLQAPEGTPPDVWKQIPAVVLSAASANFERFADKPEALKSLLRAAAYASSSAAERLIEVEQDLQDLLQQMAQMQDSMAAVLAHLQLPKGARVQQL